MKRIISVFIIVILFIGTSVGTAGCKTTGYTVRIETDALDYSEIFHIEALVANRGYNTEFREKVRYEGADPKDVTTFFKKKFSRKKVVYGVDPNDKKDIF